MSEELSWIKTELPESVMAEIEEYAKKNKLSEKEKQEVTARTKKKYADIQMTPGEAIGIIAAQSIGEPGTQMSLDYNEWVIVKQEDRIKKIKIGELIDNIMQERGYIVEDGHEICGPSTELYVPSLTQDEKIEWRQVTALSRHNSPDKLIKIKTRSGREITATQFHSFVIRKDNQIVPIAGAELKPGDRIPSIRKLTIAEQANIAIINTQPILQEEVSFLTAANGMLYAYPRSNSKPLPQNMELNESFGWLTGIYLSEGNATQSYISISNTDENILNKTREFAQKFNLTVNEYDNFRGFAKGHDARINSTLLAKLLKVICGNGSANKKIPEFAYSADEPFIAGLLRGYFDGDGNVNVPRKVIRVCSKSKDLIDGIAVLLNRFGIFSTKKFDGKSYWLHISHRYAKAFLEIIGSDIVKKRVALEELSKLESRTDYNLVDVIPGIGNVLYTTAKLLGAPTRLINNFTKRQKVGRSTLARYLALFSKLATEKGVDVSENLEIMRKAAESDVVWDEIASIDYVNPEHPKVYDFTVPGSETFTTFDGLVTHNTMRTHHFVGVAELNVTMGLPRIVEILDIRKEPKTPSMFIYLKSPHNKSREAAAQVAERIKQVTIGELVKEVDVNLAELCLVLLFDTEELQKRNMTAAKVGIILDKKIKGLNINISGSKITVTPKEKDIKKLYRLKEKVKDVPVAGIKEIVNTLPVFRKDKDSDDPKKGEYVIQTFGSNLKDVLLEGDVDLVRTTTNNIYEISKVLGVEAARQSVINELVNVLEEQGMPVDIRHILLVADLMCASGELKGITRHGITSQKTSVLARASFEIPLTHLIAASTVGETDKLSSVVENIMINQPIPIGTGLPDLIVKMDKDKETSKKGKK